MSKPSGRFTGATPRQLPPYPFEMSSRLSAEERVDRALAIIENGIRNQQACDNSNNMDSNNNDNENGDDESCPSSQEDDAMNDGDN
mmetsp:Transcript_8677/g.20804  ORF Transcript_8677/g.20804 Transcript_8677/m.20804 type:complete len:86 (-) Transcript_8677:328-585(-)|eukprot:CAMPEP_0113635764 /NCGR_PEP_ID=MMETSP0017_2-20120614/18647_1 /TAXON_ID=2856 /ORGANISM="Cylindrotheca closterium" /LENGTH=85 /DNA_ID=CAMNT_0000546567 /DNA_START=186 /DNA_END=443 /DNA_ORIENTATION=+ /assembly_acc=CAM_ASM_000147